MIRSGLVWFGKEGEGGYLDVLFKFRHWRWTFDLYIDFEKLSGGWWVVHLDFSVSSGPLLSFDIEIEIGDGSGPELDKN